MLKQLKSMGVADTTISEHPSELGATADSPCPSYRDPVSTFIVTQLIRAREGKSAPGSGSTR